MTVDPRWKVGGWVLTKKLDQEKEEEAEGTKTGPTLGEVWITRVGGDGGDGGGAIPPETHPRRQQLGEGP